MRMFTSISIKEWKKKFKKGLKANEVEGTTFNRKLNKDIQVILCQHDIFAYGYGEYINNKFVGDKCIIIEFEKPLKEIYIDYDDGIEVLSDSKKELIKEGDKTYNRASEKQLDKFSMYGSYVKEIKKEEIIAIYEGEWISEENFNHKLKEVIQNVKLEK